MAMSYASLTAAKGVSGSIANWVAYTLLDLPPLVDEAQTLLYSILRCREMRSTAVFTIPVANFSIALSALVPNDGSLFLDPIGRIRCPSLNLQIPHVPEGVLQGARLYDYPQLMRVACMAAAANFMKDDTEYQKQLSMLQIMVERVQVQDDLIYRGADITMDTPGAAAGYEGW
jgi:hypothetical protein